MPLIVAAIAFVGGLAVWYGFALARTVHGYPTGRHGFGRATARLDENRFLPGDIRELDEAFSRIVRSHFATD